MLRGLSGSWSSSGSGSSTVERWLSSQKWESNSGGPGAQGARDTAQDPTSPPDRQRPGWPRTARTLLPRAEQISGPAPWSLQVLQTE